MGDDSGEMVRMSIDSTLCIGSGQCEMLQAGTFRVEDTAIASVIGSGLLKPEQAKRVADQCPSGAIVFTPVSRP